MQYSEFVEKYESGSLKANVDRNAAGFMYKDPNLLPRNIRKRQAIQRAIAFAGLIGGAVSFIWLPYWGAVPIIIFFLASFRQIQNESAKGVLEAALLDALVHDLAIEKNVLRLEYAGTEQSE